MKRASLFFALSMALVPATSLAAPGAKAPAVRPVPEPPPLAAPLERRLFSDSIEASSFLWNDWNRFQENYHPNYIADDDAVTGWVEGVEGSGAGEWVRVAVTPLEGTTKVRLKIRNGYQKSAALFKANARAKGVTVKLLPSGKTVKAVLTDKQGWQEVAIEQASGQLRAVELGVESVYEGSKYADLVISDVQVFATSVTRDNPTFEKSKREGLLQWRKARMAAAKLFKSGKGNALPLYSSYRAAERKLPANVEQLSQTSNLLEAAAADPGFAEWREAVELARTLQKDYDGMISAQVAPVDGTTLPEVDGFQLLELSEAYEGFTQDQALRLPMLGYTSAFFAEKLRILDQKGSKHSDYQESVYIDKCRPAAWVKRAKAIEANAPDRVVALLVARCGEVEDRGGTSMVAVEQLMVFGKDGRLTLVVGGGYVDGYRWEPGGKISGGRSLQYGRGIELTKGQVAAK